jgi:hypothetical protein
MNRRPRARLAALAAIALAAGTAAACGSGGSSAPTLRRASGELHACLVKEHADLARTGSGWWAVRFADGRHVNLRFDGDNGQGDPMLLADYPGSFPVVAVHVPHPLRGADGDTLGACLRSTHLGVA